MLNISPECRERLLKTNMLTPKEAVARGQLEGYNFSEHALRQWLRSGAIPSRQIGTGRKHLIFWDNIVHFLTCQDGADNQPATMSTGTGIRRL